MSLFVTTFVALSWFGTEPAFGLLWLNPAAKRLPEGANAFTEEEIIHFLMTLKYRQKALGALLPDQFLHVGHSCSQGVAQPCVLYMSRAAWIRGMLFPQSSYFKVLGISTPFPGTCNTSHT